MFTWTELKYDPRDFSGASVVKSPFCNAGGVRSIPGQRAKIPHAAKQLTPPATTTEPARWSVCAPARESVNHHKKSCMM